MPHVLVVDDDLAVRDVAADALRDAGFTVSLASNGIEALDRVRDPASAPDVVLLDLSMPIIDGWEFVDAWRTSRGGTQGRLVVMSGVADAGEKVDKLRPDAFVEKPFDIETLITAVRHAAEQPAARTA